MELLDRYLQAIEFWLPKRQRQDIIAELSEDLRSQMEEKERELGRSLNDGEVATILERCGSPLEVATRYLPKKYLIGPDLFPVYRFVLGILLLAVVVPRFLLWIVFLLVAPAQRGYLHMENMGTIVLCYAFFTTLIFAIIELQGIKLNVLNTWNPRKLPPLRDRNRISRFSSLFEIAASVVFNVWFAGMFWPQPIINLYAAQIYLKPASQLFFCAFLALAVGNVALSIRNLFRPYWTVPRAIVRLIFDTIGAGIFCWFLKAHLWLRIAAPNLSEARGVALASAGNRCFAAMLSWAVAVTVVIIGFDSYRILRVRGFVRSKGSRASLTKNLSNPMPSGN